MLRRLTLGLAIALMGAGLALLVGIPLPWMLGPLLLTAATRMLGINTMVLNEIRNLGQWMIGISLGLYFTAEVMYNLAAYWEVIVAAVMFSLLLGLLGSWALMRFAALDFSTAWFASAIGGASEMAYMAEKAGLRVDQVASVHSVRVIIVVVLIPFGFEFLSTPASQAMLLSPALVQWPGLLYLLGWSGFVGYVSHRIGLPNAWMLGPLFATLALTVQGIEWSALPAWMSSLGQLCIGWSLGDRFRPDFFRSAPRLLGVSAVFTLLMLVLTFVLAWGLHRLMGHSLETLILAMSPGGIAEMTITAKVLGLGVPMVTAVHVTRLVAVILSAGPLHKSLAPYLKLSVK